MQLKDFDVVQFTEEYVTMSDDHFEKKMVIPADTEGTIVHVYKEPSTAYVVELENGQCVTVIGSYLKLKGAI